MNTKGLSFLIVALLALVVVPVLPAAQGVAQGLVALPPEFTDFILTLVTAGIAWLLLKVNLGDFTQPLAAVIAPIITTVLERLLGQIPPVYDNLVVSILHLIVLALGSIGAVIVARRFRQSKQLLQ